MMAEQRLAPIVLFVYNRPDHTRQTLEALMANALASQSELYIFADGPKPDADEITLSRIAQTRQVAQEKQWCHQVHLVESERNKGLAVSIVQGVTEIVNQYGKVIVLEDDIVTSPGFLKYMNEALSFYEAEERVMHISAFMYPVKEKLPPTFFYNATSCWGWGTWKRAWNYFEFDTSLLYNSLLKNNKIEQLRRFNNGDFLDQLMLNLNGTSKTWAVRWQVSVLLKDGLCLHPYKSLINNIGLDGSGENCEPTNVYNRAPSHEVEVNPIILEESELAVKSVYNFHNPTRSRLTIPLLIIKKIKHLLKSFILL